jgi:hypothetical protein
VMPHPQHDEQDTDGDPCTRPQWRPRRPGRPRRRGFVPG